ncbi:peptidyl-tRNA hydrolase [Candidatus Wolfebacteria bacterium]|nr:peptidyl-tRNA hydrolase [Candidatus Wolfebacteria bacterium]
MSNTQKFKLIIGLGNPGEEYKETYHNTGDLFVEFLKGKTAAKTLRASETQTFMNEIGKEALKAMKKSRIKPDEILIAHDDADIELGDYKISFGSGSAGHKGVKSIIKFLGTKNFWRLRIGILKKNFFGKKIKAGKIVLKKITSSDWEKLSETFEKITAEIDPVRSSA